MDREMPLGRSPRASWPHTGAAASSPTRMVREGDPDRCSWAQASSPRPGCGRPHLTVRMLLTRADQCRSGLGREHMAVPLCRRAPRRRRSPDRPVGSQAAGGGRTSRPVAEGGRRRAGGHGPTSAGSRLRAAISAAPRGSADRPRAYVWPRHHTRMAFDVPGRHTRRPNSTSATARRRNSLGPTRSERVVSNRPRPANRAAAQAAHLERGAA